MSKQKTRSSRLQQYILVGAGLGLYFGLFFRPVREPNFAVAVALALLATAVVTVLALLKKDRPPLAVVGQTAVSTFIKFALALALLEARHFAFDLGGKWAVTTFTTLAGGLLGWWMARNQQAKSRIGV